MKHTSIYSFASGKGGVGKTLLSAAFGVTLARRGQRVLLIDGDMGMRNMDLLLSVQDDCFYNSVDLAEGKCFARDVILPVADGLDFLPAANGVTWDEIFPAAIETVLEDVGDKYDAIVFDCPAGRGEGIRFASDISTQIIVVVAPSYASKRNAEEVMAHLDPRKEARFLFNQFTNRRKDWISFSDIEEELDPDRFLGVIPYSVEADRLSHEGHIMDLRKDGAFGKAMAAAARTASEGVEYPLSRWESFIRMADMENEKGVVRPVTKPGLSWRSSSRPYRWQRRR